MNTNESPYPPPSVVGDAVLAALQERDLNRYPDHSAGALYEALSGYLGVARERLWVANGSNEVFLHLFMAYGGPGRTVLVFEPTYSMHTKIALMTGAAVVHGERSEDWTVGPDQVEEAIDRHRPDVCVFCSPNNPTGALERRDAIEAALESVPLVVVDEAYIEFADDPGISTEEPTGLVVVRTLSKAWRLAGGRIGYAIGTPELTEDLARVALPYGISTITQAIGEAVLSARSEALAHVQGIVSERSRLFGGMEDLGLQPWPSQANFILIPFPSRQATSAERSSAVWEGLLERGILVRDLSEDPRLKGHLRVTAGTPDETDAFLEALKEVLDG